MICKIQVYFAGEYNIALYASGDTSLCILALKVYTQMYNNMFILYILQVYIHLYTYILIIIIILNIIVSRRFEQYYI